MDPLSHVLFGRTLIALDRDGHLGRRSVAACVLGTLAPDVDAIAIARGWDVYLRVHEGGTHSILGSVAVASAAAGLVHLPRRGGRYASLVVAAWIGALSHLAFDLLSGARIAPGWPLFAGTLSIPLVAMADPWLVAVCVSGGIALWVERGNIAKHARSVIAVIAMFLGVKALLLVMAVPYWTASTRSDEITTHAVQAVWGSLAEWDVFDRTPQALRRWRVSALGGRATLLFSLPLDSGSPPVEASHSLDTVGNFLRVHQLGFAIADPAENGGTRVLWSDIRYCRSGTDAAAQARTHEGSITCTVWFGGIYDRAGRPLRQVVRVGRWLQTRPVEP